MDTLEFLDGASAPAEDASAAEAPATTETTIETPSSEPASPEVPAPGAEAAAAEPGQTQERETGPAHIPIGALLDEREKRQAAERELQRLQAMQPPPPGEEPPNPYDAEEYAEYQRRMTQQAVQNAQLNTQEEFVREKFGDEEVDKAKAWVETRVRANPSFYSEMMGQRNPWRYAVEQFQRDQVVSSLDATELEQFRAWKQAQANLTAQPQASPPAAQTQTPAAPPRSIANMHSAAGAEHVPLGGEVVFAEVFKG